mmetsp:Transcript_9094/g.28602  ORF Transcript_9094/g.28602 Transcript_9094/m.28602 type:complete len:278 (+) Transcript_9094:3-836(+)
MRHAARSTRCATRTPPSSRPASRPRCCAMTPPSRSRLSASGGRPPPSRRARCSSTLATGRARWARSCPSPTCSTTTLARRSHPPRTTKRRTPSCSAHLRPFLREANCAFFTAHCPARSCCCSTASSTTTRCPPRRCASTSSRPTPTQTRTRSRKRCCSHAAVTQRHTLSPRTRRAHRGYSARCASACSTVRGWRQASRRASTSRLRPRAPRTRRWSGQRSDSSLVRCAQASRVAARRTTRRCSPAARARGACCRMRSRRLCDGVSRRSARSTRRSSA